VKNTGCEVHHYAVLQTETVHWQHWSVSPTHNSDVWERC